jgi:hypothetical protein
MFRVKRINPDGRSFLKRAASSRESSVPFTPSSSSDPSMPVSEMEREVVCNAFGWC